MPTALIADDEPNLSAELAARLSTLWPDLEIVGMPGNGVDALAALNAKRPDFAFLDIRMPGIDGLKIAGLVPHVRVVFVTAYDEYAVRAFDESALDYLLKPVTDERLLRCIARLQRGEAAPARPALPPHDTHVRRDVEPIRWLTVGIRDKTRLVPIDDVLYFQAADKYTEVVTADERHVIRTPLKEMLQRLDSSRFAQVHRGVIVSYAAIDHIERDLLGRQRIHLRGHRDVLPVSRTCAALFRQM
ncbi:LytR/AlgR family response regulator transcription factor [Burkholderia pseudomultivorans]|uniref:Transcriptional regulatory protein BtsR n=1 Tax=Burkholderia pseudomultivorans TaxID=1207504 RepID=A0ABU2E8N3_9BURK|nr:LytTR family DNA-binding domain-containing protein [Burkholderia pseudomultivorans]MDR8727155.1 Transcriptional regulatory protein BtsR [Burkholderia pseudomultivorans]MDR8733006.1 Transcriptional regulatory protein BtsR [Burkholderia pseudomultivorans]MDR8739872.1 Transcriptional regulatory protein BtsR [Burkholderia pseudomultivorans]MDR8756046.1 Transcriptional regulatory protein BtsR [Burkholderia pseudomultivorans]MDR8775978.1 Transcriptional regulatory protein BtsR [Burkholderia pseud